MATDSTAAGVFTIHEEIPSIDPSSLFFFAENPTLGLSDEHTLNPDQNYLNCPSQKPGHELDPDDPFSDPAVWAFCNGINVKRLEIHGRFGVITHAVLGIYDFGSSFQSQDFQMFDTEMVKKFLVQYFEACKQEGYNIMQDPLSTFYEALCVGLNEPDNPNDFLQSSPENTGDFPNSQLQESLKQPEGGSNQVGFMKIPLSMQVAQRERTRNLKLKDFVDYFDLPIEDAARKMNICPTVMKKICRRNGVLRWPYRKIKSIKRKLSKKVKILDASDSQERARALEDIQKHQQELAHIYQVFNQ
ncbi:hypothetical protein DH2020_002623 [Rehmannia glutinosa]|uniref:RWP-RK domain-containing protein n=1 Tax=Rehmannia glutinosa TaxID=99300 RepID=A0ABR0XUA8_REHGL